MRGSITLLVNRQSTIYTTAQEFVPLLGLIPGVWLAPVALCLFRKPITLITCIFDRRLISIDIISLASISKKSIVAVGKLNCPLKRSNQRRRRCSLEWISESSDSSITFTYIRFPWASNFNPLVKIATVFSDSQYFFSHQPSRSFLMFLVCSRIKSSRISLSVAFGGTDLWASSRVSEVKDVHRSWSLNGLEYCVTFATTSMAFYPAPITAMSQQTSRWEWMERILKNWNINDDIARQPFCDRLTEANWSFGKADYGQEEKE